jgi:hypothetical protein
MYHGLMKLREYKYQAVSAETVVGKTAVFSVVAQGNSKSKY